MIDRRRIAGERRRRPRRLVAGKVPQFNRHESLGIARRAPAATAHRTDPAALAAKRSPPLSMAQPKRPRRCGSSERWLADRPTTPDRLASMAIQPRHPATEIEPATRGDNPMSASARVSINSGSGSSVRRLRQRLTACRLAVRPTGHGAVAVGRLPAVSFPRCRTAPSLASACRTFPSARSLDHPAACVHAGSSPVRRRTIATQSSLRNGLNAVSPDWLAKRPEQSLAPTDRRGERGLPVGVGIAQPKPRRQPNVPLTSHDGHVDLGQLRRSRRKNRKRPVVAAPLQHNAHEPPPGGQFQFDRRYWSRLGESQSLRDAAACGSRIDRHCAGRCGVGRQCARPDRACRRSKRSKTLRRPAFESGRAFGPCSRFASKPRCWLDPSGEK